jgi:hypothetical protein
MQNQKRNMYSYDSLEIFFVGIRKDTRSDMELRGGNGFK